MHCGYCGASYAPEELRRGSGLAEPMIAGAEDVDGERKRPTMRVNIATCSSCGAELAVNQVEVSSFCPYCGNASVVMDRVEDRLAPDYVIPFKVTQKEAEEYIRRRLRNGPYIPDEIKNFELEKLRGIYIPFWLYDVYFGSEQEWKYTTSSGRNSSTRYMLTLGDCTYHQLTVDASRAFNDNSSQRLEPYVMQDLKPFDPVYLSGFYSDRFDVGYAEADKVAIARSENMFNTAMKNTAGVRKSATLLHSMGQKKVLGRDYALLPVWFLTFRHENEPYTILLNGQTKKMVGAVPMDKRKAFTTFALFGLVLCSIFAFVGGYLAEYLWYAETHSKNSDGDGVKIFFYWIMVIGLLWWRAIKRYRSMKKSIELSRSRTNNRLAKERQDRV